MFALLGVLAILQALGKLTGSARYLMPMPLLGAGIGAPFLVFVLRHNKSRSLGEIMVDPAQRAHWIMALLLTIAGFTELTLVAGWTTVSALAYVFPAVLFIIGVMFMVHHQHGDADSMAAAMRFHRILGCVFMAAGIVRGIQIAKRDGDGVLAYTAAILLLIIAGLLITYREPPGAFTGGGGHH